MIIAFQPPSNFREWLFEVRGHIIILLICLLILLVFYVVRGIELATEMFLSPQKAKIVPRRRR